MYLPCFITGYYKPSKVVWYKNNAQIFTNGTEFFVESKEEDNFTITYALQKNYPSPDDAALYSCKATNVYGASARANRNVTRCMISGTFDLDTIICNYDLTAKNRASSSKYVDILQQTCSQQTDIRMRSHDLRQLVDDKSVGSCPQACCKLSKLVIHRLWEETRVPGENPRLLAKR